LLELWQWGQLEHDNKCHTISVTIRLCIFNTRFKYNYLTSTTSAKKSNRTRKYDVRCMLMFQSLTTVPIFG